ncbi:MAG: hypothetical protein D6688_11820 [Alphaproteobacteria bacterium]|nr:MAG: hypothetical protein D6688_11820 [Alphaproteobacteria bacterium]
MTRLSSLLLWCFAALGLAACGAEPVWAPDDAVAAAAYHHDGPPSITLITAVNNRSGEGGHSALLINASQRVMFDPAGTWWHRTVPERNDVLYGMTPTMLSFYIDYHARSTYHLVIQEKEVPPEVAELALARAEAFGAAPKAFCSRSVSAVLQGLPGFETIPHSFFPVRTMKAFAKLPGVRTSYVYDDDADDNKVVLTTQNALQP